MSRRRRSQLPVKRRRHAHVFAALGDETRLALVAKLSRGRGRSISQLTRGSRLTRQAITKHLRVLEGAGIVHSARIGRENVFGLDPEPMEEIEKYLERVWSKVERGMRRVQPGILFPCLHEDKNVGVGISPQREKIMIGGAGFGASGTGIRTLR